MSILNILSVFSLFVFANTDSVSPITKYRDSCDNIDIDNLLKNQVLVNSYVNCLLNKSPCTRYGKEIKSAIPEILSRTCTNCSPNQKRIVRRVMNFLYTNRRSDFDALFDLYDPEKKYRSSMINFMTHADHDVSELQAPSNGTLYKPVHLPRHSPKPTPPTSEETSIAEPLHVTGQKFAHTMRSRSPRSTSRQSSPIPTSASDVHRTHKPHFNKHTLFSTLSSSS